MDHFQIVQNIFSTVRRRQAGIDFLSSFFKGLKYLVGIYLVAGLINALWLYPNGVRYLLLVFLILITAGIGGWYGVKPFGRFLGFWQNRDDNSIARFLGSRFPDVHDQLLNAWQLVNPPSDLYSKELIDAAFADIAQRLQQKDFGSILPLQQVIRELTRTVLYLLFCSSVIFIFPHQADWAMDRLFHPGKTFTPLPNFTLQIEKPDSRIAKGSDFEIRVRAQGNVPAEVQLFYRDPQSRNYEQRTMTHFSPDLFHYQIKELRNNLEFFAQSQEVKSDQGKVQVVQPPTIRNWQVRLDYPGYTKLGTKFLDQNVGDVTAIKGTRVLLSAEVDKPLEKSSLVVNDSILIPLSSRGSKFYGTFRLLNDGKYYASVIDREGMNNIDPITYRLNVTQDEFPTVRIIDPPPDIELSENSRLPVTVELRDDFGYHEINLKYRVISSLDSAKEYQKIVLNFPVSKNELILSYDWDLGTLNLLPETQINYFAEVYDNDDVSGPKRSKTEVYIIRFPSLQELFARANEQTDRSVKDIEDISKKAEEAEKKLEETRKNLEKDKNLNWETKKQIEEGIQKQTELNEKLKEVSRQMKQMMEEAEKHGMLSAETMKKLEELQQLFSEILTPELQKAIQELQKAMEQNLDPKKVQEAMRNLQLSEANFRKNIERTLELMKRVQAEQKMDEMVRMAQELMERQQKINEQVSATPAEDKKQMEQLSRQEELAGQDMNSLEKSPGQLEKLLSEDDDQTRAMLDSLQQVIHEMNTGQQMQQMQQQLSRQQKQAAQKQGNQISRNLQQLNKRMQELRQQMMRDRKNAVVKSMQKASHQMLTLSENQEGLMDQSRGLNPTSPKYQEITENQLGVINGLSKVAQELVELSQKTFFVSSDLGKTVGRSFQKMNQALTDLEQRDGMNASQSQLFAMAELNQAVILMNQAMSKASQSQSATGLEEYIQQLQQMTGQQQGLNDETLGLGLGEGEEEKYSMEQRAAMQRLAAEQKALQQSLEQLQGNMGKQNNLLGRLDQVTGEMEEVAKDLANQRVNPKTIERQQRILSRLLDAQRSIREQDYSEKRKAEAGKDYPFRSPGAIPKGFGETKNKIQEEYLKSLQQGFTKDYEELIKNYFESLSKHPELPKK